MNKEEIKQALEGIKKDINDTNYIYYYDHHRCIRRLVALLEDIIDTNLY